MTTSRDNLIASCCLDEGRPSKLHDAWTSVKAHDHTIRLAEVRGWLQRHRTKLTGGARGAEAPKADAPESAEPEPSWTKDQIIEHYYEAYNNIGNVEKTWKQAREVDKSITKKDVQDWKRRNYAPLRAHRGLNSYVATEPREEYQMDIMFLKDLEKEIDTEEPLYEAALLMVDIFTKYCWAEPIIGKDTKYIKAITECMDKMAGKPKMIAWGRTK